METHMGSMSIDDMSASLSEPKKGTEKNLKKTWIRSISTFFKRKFVKTSAKSQDEQTLSMVSINEQEQMEEAIAEQQMILEILTQPPRHTLDTKDKVSNVDDEGGSIDYQSTNDGVVSSVDSSGKHELEPLREAFMDGTCEYRFTELRSAIGLTAKNYRNNPQELNSSNAHTIFFRHDDLSIEVQLPITLIKENTTHNESNTGCLCFGKTSSEKCLEKVPKGKIIYSRPDGKEEETIVFDVSLNDILMQEVLNSIQEGQLPVGLAKYGRQGKLINASSDLDKCTSSKSPSDTSDEFSVNIELCDPPMGNGEKFGSEQTNGNNIERSNHNSDIPELVELTLGKQIEENDGIENEDLKSRSKALQEGNTHWKEILELAKTRVSISSDNSIGSYNSESIEFFKEEHEKARGQNIDGLKHLNNYASASKQSRSSFIQPTSNIFQLQQHRGRKSSDKLLRSQSKRCEYYQRDEDSVHSANQFKDNVVDEIIEPDQKNQQIRKYPSSNSSMEYSKANIRKRCPSSILSLEDRQSKIRSNGMRSYQLRDKNAMLAHMEISQLKSSQKSKIKHSTFRTCMASGQKQNTSPQGSDSLSTRSKRYHKVDISDVSDDSSHLWKPHIIHDKKFYACRINKVRRCSPKYYSGGKDEENVCTISDDETQSCRTSNSESSSNMKTSPKRVKREEWNLEKGAGKHKTISLHNEKIATTTRKNQSSCHIIDPSDDNTNCSCKESIAPDDSEHKFLDNVSISKLNDSLPIQAHGVEYKNTWDDDYYDNYLHGKQVNIPKRMTCHYHLIENQECTGNVPEQTSERGCEDRGFSSKLIDQNFSALTQKKKNERSEPQDFEGNSIDDVVKPDEGPENKWFQRIGNLSIAQESDDYDMQHQNEFIQHETKWFLPQEPQDGYTSDDDEEKWIDKMPYLPKNKSSHNQQDKIGEILSYQHLQPLTESCVKETTLLSTTFTSPPSQHAALFHDTDIKVLKYHGSLSQDEVDSKDEISTSDWASNMDSKNLKIHIRTDFFKPQVIKIEESVSQTLEASQLFLQSVPKSNCCHVKSRLDTKEFLSSPSKVRKLSGNPFAIEGDTSDLMTISTTSISAPKQNPTEDQATEHPHIEVDEPIYDDYSRQYVARCAHAGPRRKARCILAGVIKSDTKEIIQQKDCEEPCQHEFVQKECKNMFMNSSEHKRRRNDKSAFDHDEGHAKSSPDVSHVHEIHPYDFDDLKQREVSGKQCHDIYEGKLKGTERLLEQINFGLDICQNTTTNKNQLDVQNHDTLIDTNVTDKSNIQSDAHTQNLSICYCERSQPNIKVLQGKYKISRRSLSDPTGRVNIFPKDTVKSMFKRNESEDSSSDDDIYDQASRKFRDELFKRVSRENEQSLTIPPKVLTINYGGCIDQEMRNKVHKIQRHLRTLTRNDPFRFSSIYKELIQVKQDMKEIARTFTNYRPHEQTNYKKSIQTSDSSLRSQKKLKSTIGQCEEKHIDNKDGRLENIDKSPQEVECDSSVSLYENPLSAKQMTSKTKSCGDPLSVRMASRLIDVDVPIDYKNGYRVQYIPIDKRGNMGMRDKHQGWQERYKLYRLEEIIDHRRNSRLSAYDSSSSSEKQERSPNMQIKDFSKDLNYESSSSDYGSKILYRRHQREVSKEARCIRKQKYEDEDSNSMNSSFRSDDGATNLDLFIGEAEEQLARLKLAKIQLGRLSSKAITRLNTYNNNHLSKNNKKVGLDPWTIKMDEGDSKLSMGRRDKCVLKNMKKSTSMVVTSLPTKKSTVGEIKEFHLLERRVQRELAAARMNSKHVKCQAMLYP